MFRHTNSVSYLLYLPVTDRMAAGEGVTFVHFDEVTGRTFEKLISQPFNELLLKYVSVDWVFVANYAY